MKTKPPEYTKKVDSLECKAQETYWDDVEGEMTGSEIRSQRSEYERMGFFLEKDFVWAK